ncbi:putative hydrolase [Fulvia fulva]|uniref:Hydrolase n=1 Tax=Passalora fulva TaxID=5499 RepID=A0A9Q8L6K4_PASFU|nr:putative hydrolase [Fulvia fulva]KAK4635979.1 putative hydrolase [Fulvia fulva]KAK4638563.1 putative hydrolase [Fulvia fulva]UJO11138.1 putative hydrolase [Fulvia fulva]WPV09107.1 putative hydrolase [Fulvia fulva]WPV25117.1 putative hydrolase [Fulvia fulva]
MLASLIVFLLSHIAVGNAKCFEPTPAFPLPRWDNGGPELEPAFQLLETNIQDLASQAKYDNTSFSIEVTSLQGSLWSYHHSARVHNESRPGVTHVDSLSQYRIASITKVFTTLAILYQHDAGNLSLDDPVLNYISELRSDEYELPWKDITIRVLASQLSGIPREFAQGDLLNLVPDPSALGLPPVSQDALPTCDEYDSYKPCDRGEFLGELKGKKPLFAPNQKSTYSNLNFELLGLVLENVTGMPYSDYIQQAIFDPLEMTESSLSTPSDEHAVLPAMADGFNYWDVDEGVQAPTGGIYSTSSDLSKFIRYTLSHYNTLATGVNWFLPASWATGMNTFYGMPFETFRTDKILRDSRRPVTFVTKAGGLPGYYSRISMLEEYGLGITILVGGTNEILEPLNELVSVALVRAAEEIAWQRMAVDYPGTYAPIRSDLNTSLVLATSPSKGLHVETFISNGTDVLAALLSKSAPGDDAEQKQRWHAQLVPTLLFENEEAPKGEIWRMQVVSERSEEQQLSAGVWDEFCPTDLEGPLYAGVPVNKIVFWHELGTVELPAWNISMKRVSMSKDMKDNLFVQKQDL